VDGVLKTGSFDSSSSSLCGVSRQGNFVSFGASIGSTKGKSFSLNNLSCPPVAILGYFSEAMVLTGSKAFVRVFGESMKQVVGGRTSFSPSLCWLQGVMPSSICLVSKG
jgi:hypothetical protein